MGVFPYRPKRDFLSIDQPVKTIMKNPANSALGFNFAARASRIAFLLTAIFVSLIGASLQATTVDPPDFATLVNQAEVILSGQVIDVRCEWVGQGDQRHIESYIAFKLLKSLKGGPREPFVLNMVGGTIGDETLEIAGAPKFKVGDRAILFVENNGTQVVPLVGIMHGHYRMVTDSATGEEVVHKYDGTPLGGTEEIDQIHARGPFPDRTVSHSMTNRPMTRTGFEQAIERQLWSNGQ
jgi:hypothetical protein